jgi:Protein of unknown function (DUF3551)
MSKQLTRLKTTLAVIALAGMTLVHAGSARAEKAAAWCAYYDDQSTNCGFATFEQCEADISGVGGVCSRNPEAD